MKRVFIVAGELSGDMHAAEMIHELKQSDPTLRFYGVGGPAMRAADCDTLIDIKELAVVGIIEVLKHIVPIWKAVRLIRKRLRKDKPDLVILVDYPGMNLRLARYAKSLGLQVIYYISPQLWAWRGSRIKFIKRYVDCMAVILPFEVDYYKQHQVEAFYVGNSLVKTVQPTLDRLHAYQQFHLDADRKCFALVPGSRQGEIKRLLPVMLEAALVLKKQYPDAQFVLPLAKTISRDWVMQFMMNSSLEIQIIPNALYDLIPLCDAAITCSGTATLEIALLGTPQVIIYKVANFSYQIAKRLIKPAENIRKVRAIGLCNLIADDFIAKELIQQDANVANIVNEIRELIENHDYRQKIREKMTLLQRALTADEQSRPMTELVFKQLKSN